MIGPKVKIKLRSPKIGESQEITNLVLRSKAHWGYSNEFMASVTRELTVTEEYLKNAASVVAEVSGVLVGFAGISLNNTEIEFLFVDPVYIGKGIGKLLWEEILRLAKPRKLNRLKVLSNPGAQAFYEKMGAKQIGTAMSSVRILPLLEIEFG